MIIKDIITGNFMERPNRFTVLFNTNDKIEKAHLRDPGRLKELLIPGSPLLLRSAKNTTKRKTKYDVIAVLNEDIWVLINSGFHNHIAAELIESRQVDEFKWYNIEKREYNYGKSRLDFLLSNNNVKMLLEVKGCTLVENGLAKFPDAPTTRGKRHLKELMLAKSEGLNAAVLFLIMREDAVEFTPNWEMDPDFSNALFEANKKNVEIIAYSFKILLNKNNLIIKPFRKLKLNLNKYQKN
jgi:sugar fermentation stimulation protein A